MIRSCFALPLSVLMALLAGTVIAAGPAHRCGKTAAHLQGGPSLCPSTSGCENQFTGATDLHDQESVEESRSGLGLDDQYEDTSTSNEDAVVAETPESQGDSSSEVACPEEEYGFGRTVAVGQEAAEDEEAADNDCGQVNYGDDQWQDIDDEPMNVEARIGYGCDESPCGGQESGPAAEFPYADHDDNGDQYDPANDDSTYFSEDEPNDSDIDSGTRAAPSADDEDDQDEDYSDADYGSDVIDDRAAAAGDTAEPGYVGESSSLSEEENEEEYSGVDGYESDDDLYDYSSEEDDTVYMTGLGQEADESSPNDEYADPYRGDRTDGYDSAAGYRAGDKYEDGMEEPLDKDPAWRPEEEGAGEHSQGSYGDWIDGDEAAPASSDPSGTQGGNYPTEGQSLLGAVGSRAMWSLSGLDGAFYRIAQQVSLAAWKACKEAARPQHSGGSSNSPLNRFEL